MGCWKFEVETRETYVKKKYSIYLGTPGRVVLHHFEDFGKKGNLLVVLLMFWYVPIKKNWVHLGVNVELWKKIWLVDANWNYDNLKVLSLKKIDPPNLQFLPCFFDSLDTLIRIRNWLDVVSVVRKQEYCIRTCIIGVIEWSKRITWISYHSYEVAVSSSYYIGKITKVYTSSFFVTIAQAKCEFIISYSKSSIPTQMHKYKNS